LYSRKLGGTQDPSAGGFRGENLFPPGFEPGTLQPRYIDCTILIPVLLKLGNNRHYSLKQQGEWGVQKSMSYFGREDFLGYVSGPM